MPFETRTWSHLGLGAQCLVLIVLALVTAAAAADTFPYIPTTILTPPADSSTSNSTTIYVFEENNGRVEFLSLDVGSKVEGDKGIWKTLSTELPFLSGKSSRTTFSPAITDNGTVMVYAGECDSSTQVGVWTYVPSNDDEEGSWRQFAMQTSGSGAKQAGPFFLGGAITFSAQLQPTVSEPVMYSFGGMCSNTSSEVKAWQSEGTYSNQMLRASPSESRYDVEAVSAKGPVREAGFTITGLLPSISSRAGAVTQQNSYVLLGGHTQDAFINMSTAAIWNLPEETWSFAAIKPSESGSGELRNIKAAVRADGGQIHSRSGHSAVLSEDGTSLIVLGGWVGTVTSQSEPQLAILKMGETYDEWEWEIPDAQPSGPGLYGHGTTLLPGNVMMVYGGYEISGSSSKMKRRDASSMQFLNLTSMTWSSSYTNPNHSADAADEEDGDSNEPSSGGTEAETARKDNKKNIGLGVGLGVGLGLIVVALLGFFCFKKCSSRRKRDRDDAIRALAQDNPRFMGRDGEMLERDTLMPGFPWPSHSWYTGGDDPYQTGSRSLGYETLRGGRGSNFRNPGCLQIPRKPVSRSRGLYQPAGVPGRIHPIYEDDEDTPEPARDPRPPRTFDSPEPQTPNSQSHSDPFMTPTSTTAHAHLPASTAQLRATATPSPETPRQDPEVQDWMSDVDAAETMLTRMEGRRSGRISPSRRNSIRSQGGLASHGDDDGRTGSNLSESTRSNISISRSMSGRSRPRSGGFNSSFGATTLLNSSTMVEGHQGSSDRSSSPSYSTARSSFPVLQAEGPSLLMGTDKENDEDETPIPGSPSKNRPRRGWLGSLRRVFNATPTGSHESDASSRTESPDHPSLDNASSDYEHRLVGLSGIGGGSLLRRKQGKQGWEQVPPGEEPRKSGDTDWDIERAVEQRLVQVMFTVPKEKLRVVNAEIDKEEEVVLVDPSDESLQGSVSSRIGKGKNVVAGGVIGARELLYEKDGGDDVFAPGKEEPEHGEKMLEETSRSRPRARTPGIRDEDSPAGSDVLHTAEELRMERPRTKVLEMVEAFEGRSRDSSPSVKDR